MKAPANCRLIGRWRIVESDLWDRAHLDLSGPATLTITANEQQPHNHIWIIRAWIILSPAVDERAVWCARPR